MQGFGVSWLHIALSTCVSYFVVRGQLQNQTGSIVYTGLRLRTSAASQKVRLSQADCCRDMSQEVAV